MNSETNPEIIEARKKMAEQFGNLRLGGKGIRFIFITLK